MAAGEPGQMAGGGRWHCQRQRISLQKGQVKLGEAAADDVDKGKENGQCWIKNKLNTASTHGVFTLAGLSNTKGRLSQQ